MEQSEIMTRYEQIVLNLLEDNEKLKSHVKKLEAALREIADGPRDVDKSYLSLFHEIQSEARKALEGKDD